MKKLVFYALQVHHHSLRNYCFSLLIHEMDDNQCRLQVLKQKITTWLIELDAKVHELLVPLCSMESIIEASHSTLPRSSTVLSSLYQVYQYLHTQRCLISKENFDVTAIK
jgi:hypothetical protein